MGELMIDTFQQPGQPPLSAQLSVAGALSLLLPFGAVFQSLGMT